MEQRYFDRDGTALSMEQWATSASNKRVAEDTVNGYWISTVWLGIDHQFGEGPPLIFETMVFGYKDTDIDYSALDCERYSTEAEALAGHAAMVAKYEGLVAS